ncbi:MAG: dTDP-glucose 4,6-dehydratase [Armatimonadetes bacterium]|nr:dTDP-glucose 4,6-dehydratase [Armatimonadota bacterium]
MRKILVTGGAGFIGSHFIRLLLTRYDYEVVNLDALMYSGNLKNLSDVEGHGRYRFIHGDIRDEAAVGEAMAGADAVVHFAAESHVDRSIREPDAFLQTNIIGTYRLLEAARRGDIERFLLVSTDEVYGQVLTGTSREGDPLDPRSPYSATKASADLLVRAYWTTYGLPVVTTRGSNNFGPNQYPEKIIPLFITNAIDSLALPLYNDGKAVRDYIYVTDHCEGIAAVLHRGQPGEVYNVGGGNLKNGIEIATAILRVLGKPEGLITFVTDRPGHDLRYSLDSSKAQALGWKPGHSFETALESTVAWYRENEGWWREIKSGAYRDYYRKMYGERGNP